MWPFFLSPSWKRLITKLLLVFRVVDHFNWLFRPFAGDSGSIILLWDSQVLKLIDFRMGFFSMCCKLRSM